MSPEDIHKIQKRVIGLLKSQGEGPLNVLSSDCCSELARLVGSWIQETEGTDRLLVLKGSGLKNGSESHEVIAIVRDGEATVIDPTVWQYFPKKDIFVGKFDSLELTTVALSRIYGGEWRVGEKLTGVSDEQKDSWESVVRKVVNENASIHSIFP